MKRDIYVDLLNWKKDKNRKPLMLHGARQVGKTYILEEFGKNEYQDLAYFNFESDKFLKEFFKGTIDPLKIIEKLSISIERKIQPEKTLIVLDEIQECPEAITSLKYFYEKSNDYHIIATGSLLGIGLGHGRSFPVGKINMLHLYPFSFGEYLDGIGYSSLRELISTKKNFEKIDLKFHNELIDNLKLYFYIGGMPEAIKRYITEKDLEQVRMVHNEILEGYESDFAKYTTKTEAMKITSIWKSIPRQLALENKKFILTTINKNARQRDYNEAIEWLRKVGYIYKSFRIKIPQLPLSGYVEENVFKLFFLDVGLLSTMLELTQKTIVEGNKLFSWYNGAFTENYVAQELVAAGHKNLFYWTSNGQAEIDFILQYKEGVYPLEVKSGLHTKSKSMKLYQEEYKPEFFSRASLRNFNKSDQYQDYPLYAISLFQNIK